VLRYLLLELLCLAAGFFARNPRYFAFQEGSDIRHFFQFQ
jgi:hypothetical protein